VTAPAPELATVADQDRLREFYRDAPIGVRANMIYSTDGAVAFGGRAGPLSCAADQQLLRELRGYADVILVGAGTVRAENYGPVRLSDAQREERRSGGCTDMPVLAVISQSGRLPDTLFVDPAQQPILITSARGLRDRRPAADERVRVFEAGEHSVDIPTAVDVLRAEGYRRILCEGGPTLLQEIVQAGLLTEICLTTAPLLAGSQPVGSPTPGRLAVPTAMRLRHALVHDGYLFTRYLTC